MSFIRLLAQRSSVFLYVFWLRRARGARQSQRALRPPDGRVSPGVGGGVLGEAWRPLYASRGPPGGVEASASAPPPPPRRRRNGPTRPSPGLGPQSGSGILWLKYRLFVSSSGTTAVGPRIPRIWHPLAPCARSLHWARARRRAPTPRNTGREANGAKRLGHATPSRATMPCLGRSPSSIKHASGFYCRRLHSAGLRPASGLGWVSGGAASNAPLDFTAAETLSSHAPDFEPASRASAGGVRVEIGASRRLAPPTPPSTLV